MFADTNKQGAAHVDAELLNLDPVRESLAALPQVDVPRMRMDRLNRLNKARDPNSSCQKCAMRLSQPPPIT